MKEKEEKICSFEKKIKRILKRKKNGAYTRTFSQEKKKKKGIKKESFN